MTPILEIKEIRTAFGDNRVHDGVTFKVENPGQYIALIGGSGTGKSVLLKEILGLIRPESGTIKIFGESPDKVFSDEGIKKNPIGVLFQQGALFSSLTVLENIEAPLREHTTLGPRDRKEVAKLKLNLAGLPLSAGEKMPSELSGGMLKRAALARALSLEPKLLLCDEPTSGLDPINARAFDELILTLTGSLNITALVVTHDIDTIKRYANRIIALAEGKVLADGTIDTLYGVKHPWLEEYLNAGNGMERRG